MAEYTSKDALIARWGTDEVTRSADRDPQDGISEDDAIAAACEDATSLVESYLTQAGVTLPVNPVPAVLTMHATNVAMYQLSQSQETYTEEKRKRYDDALSWLKGLAKDKGVLGGQPAAASLARAGRSSGFPLQYSAAKLRGGGVL